MNKVSVCNWIIALFVKSSYEWHYVVNLSKVAQSNIKMIVIVLLVTILRDWFLLLDFDPFKKKNNCFKKMYDSIIKIIELQKNKIVKSHFYWYFRYFEKTIESET